MKQVKCADLGNDCDFVAKGNLDKVMAQVADHAYWSPQNDNNR